MWCSLHILLFPAQEPAAPQYNVDPPSPQAGYASDSGDEMMCADIDWDDLCSSLDTDQNTLIRPKTAEEDDPPSLAEVMLTVLDWYASHKQTYRATSDLCRMLALVVPPGTTLGTFREMRKLLEAHKLETCTEYDACRAGCIVYFDFSDTGPFASHEYASATACPKCHSQRYVGTGINKRASHTVHFFPIAPFLRDMFRRADLREHLDNRPNDSTPPASVKKSHGYREKILRDPHINTDSRNQGLVISSDGIPYFGAADKHSRGAWPVVARLASLPDGLWDRFEFAHLYALEATEHWITNVETGTVLRKRRFVFCLHANKIIRCSST